MKLRNKENDFPIHISLIDTLFCTLTFIKIITAVAIIMIEPIDSKEQKKEEKIFLEVEASLSISITWPNGPEDIDLWAIGPDGRPVGYQNTRSESLGYLRDDTGYDNSAVSTAKQNNYELITAQVFVPGHYVVNVHYYGRRGGKPSVDVKVKVLFSKKDEGTEVIYEGTVKLIHERQEKTAIQFDLTLDGTAVAKNSAQKSIREGLQNRQ